MSTAEREPTEAEGREPEARPLKGHRESLTQRDVFHIFLRDDAIRPYLFSALGALAMIFLVMFLGGSDVGGVVVVLFGLATLIFQWTAGPPFLLVILFYFQVFPFGIPELGYENPFEVRETHFRIADVILVASILIYVRSAYRIFGFVHQSMPFESVFRRKDEHPTRRPTSHIQPGEVAGLLAVAAGLVVLGQLAWWLLNALDFTPTDEDFPIQWADVNNPARYRRSHRAPGEFAPGASRFFILLGALFFGFLAIRLVFGYWRLRMMSAAEGAMVLADTSWAESHRERVRIEKWRIWGREKAREAAKEEARRQARAERARREKEEKEAAERQRRERARPRARLARADAERNGEEDDRPRRRWD